MDVTLTDSGVRISAPDKKEELMAAGSAAVLLAELFEARYGDENPISRALRTANAFSADIVKFDSDPDAKAASGQIADVYLLAMAALMWGHVHQREHNTGADPEVFIAAGEAMIDMTDTIFRQIGIKSLRGDVEEIDYRFAP